MNNLGNLCLIPVGERSYPVLLQPIVGDDTRIMVVNVIATAGQLHFTSIGTVGRDWQGAVNQSDVADVVARSLPS